MMAMKEEPIDDVNQDSTFESSDVHRVEEPQQELSLDEIDKLDLPPELRGILDLPKIAAFYKVAKASFLLARLAVGSLHWRMVSLD